MAGRTCENPGCGASLEGRDSAARYCSDRCRAAHWKARNHYGRHDPPPRRRRGGPSKTRTPEPRISYRKAQAAVGDALTGAPEDVGRRVRAALESCLSQQAREAIGSTPSD